MHPPRPTPVQALYALLVQAAAARSRSPLLSDLLQPALRRLLPALEGSFGSPRSWSPSATHVLLVAILIVLLARRD